VQVDNKIFELLVDRVRDYAVFVLDPTGHVSTWNSGARLIKGYAPEEIIGRHFSTFYTQEAIERGWPQHELKIATMQGRFEDEGWRVRKDGSRFWANVIITALRDDDGHLLGFSKITRDLSARRAEEEALRQSEERFRLLVDGVMDYAIFMLDPDGVISSWNYGAQRIKGYTRAEVLGKHFSIFYADEDIQSGKPWEELTTARKTGRAEDEGWRLRKNGEKFWARVVVSALYDGDGRLRGFAKVTQDLSQREHARELEKTAQRVNEFIAMLAHELRNPLAPIRSALQVMERLPATDPAQAAMRATIDRQSAQLTRIVDDMLDIARITRGTLKVERRVVDVAEIVERAVETAKPALEHAKHQLSVELPGGRIAVEGDLTRLIQVLANLLTNAARFTASGGKIRVSARKEGGEVVLSVRDNGRGIPAESLDSIFGMFVQGKEPVHRVGGGLGIGLALARRITELHGGTVSARSEGEGKGSEFTVRLPLVSQDAAGSLAKPAPVLAAADSFPLRRILIVDDNADAADALEALLRSLGHDTMVAYDGVQALHLAEGFRPDIVLLDIGLPGLSGYEVARRLRAMGGPKPKKIIAITGWGQEGDRTLSREAGFDVHLVKPVDEAELRGILETNGHEGTVH
jgi:hypothetical protein